MPGPLPAGPEVLPEVQPGPPVEELPEVAPMIDQPCCWWEEETHLDGQPVYRVLCDCRCHYVQETEEEE